MPNQLLICANLIPIGTYLCVLGLFHTMGRPLITTGGRDYLAMAIALSGLIITGPIDYVLHSRMLPDFLLHSHLIGLGIYLLLVAALIPRSCAKLVIYNCQLKPVIDAVRKVLERGGQNFQEVPGGWILPERGLSLEIDALAGLRNVTLHFHGMRDRDFFVQIQNELARELVAKRTGWSLVGMTMAAAGWLVLAFPLWIVARDPQNIVAAIRQVIEMW
jgi:uncharacterized membrane protein